MIKRSFTIKGHRTSVSIEQEFWDLIDRYAAEAKQSVAAVISKVDEERATEKEPTALASALRIFVLRRLLDRRTGRVE